MSTTESHELRSYERYHATPPILGSFGSAEIHVIDIGEQGAQIEHTQPLRLGTVARLWFRAGDFAVQAQALAVWSKFSKKYRTGLRIEEGAADFAAAIPELERRGLIHRDSESLERKRKLREERELAKKMSPAMRIVRSDVDVPSHQALLIEHALDGLRANPDEAQKWYSRAYFASRQGQGPMAAEMAKYHEDVLAVWEYLERSLPLQLIARVFEKRKTPS